MGLRLDRDEPRFQRRQPVPVLVAELLNDGRQGPQGLRGLAHVAGQFALVPGWDPCSGVPLFLFSRCERRQPVLERLHEQRRAQPDGERPRFVEPARHRLVVDVQLFRRLHPPLRADEPAQVDPQPRVDGVLGLLFGPLPWLLLGLLPGLVFALFGPLPGLFPVLF